MARAALGLALWALLVATSLAGGPASLRGRRAASSASAEAEAEPSVNERGQSAPTPAPAPPQPRHSPAVVEATALRPKYERVGCFRRAEGDLEDEHVYMDKTCVHAPRDDRRRPCRSGLPFFRKTMEDGQSFMDCAAFCLSKGLDLSGVVSNPAGDVSMECRCGATAGNAPAWHERAPPVGLLLPPRSSAVKEQDPACAVLVSRYVGQMDRGAVPYRFLQLSLDDNEYLDEVAEGMDDVTEEDDVEEERLGEVEVPLDNITVARDGEGGPIDMPAPAIAVAAGLCRDAELSGVTSGGRRLTCPESQRFCGQFPIVASSCPLTCGICDTPGDWLSCYPNRCSAGGGAWLTKSDADGLVYINYFFAAGLDQERREAFELAAMEFERKTCIRMVESAQTPRIEVDVINSGSCFASLGYPGAGGTSTINLGWCNSRRHVGSIIHEIGHTIGMNHEQKRSDAQASVDTPAGEKGPYLRMFWNNIDESWRSEFLPDEGSYIGSETAGYADYDYGSIMHYGRGSPGRGRNVLAFETVNPVFNSVVGSRSELSDNDVDQILDMYQCSAPGSSPTPAPTPAPTRSSSPTTGSCPSTCSNQNCNFWVQQLGFTCQQLTNQFGCDCGGCSECASTATRAPTPAPTRAPTREPTRAPAPSPTRTPTRAPTPAPTQGSTSPQTQACRGLPQCRFHPDGCRPSGCRNGDVCCIVGTGCEFCGPGCPSASCASTSPSPLAPTPPPPTPAPPAVGSDSCPNDCFGQTCNYWVEGGNSCETMTIVFGCTCGGCPLCASEPIADPVQTRPPTRAPTAAPVPAPTPGTSATRARVSELEWEHFQLLNQLRAEGFVCPSGQSFAANSVPLAFDCRLWRAAYLHSKDMADNDYFMHNSLDGRTPWERAQAQGVRASAENIAAGSSTAQAVLDQWKNSDGHCRNMMSPSNRMLGVGHAFNSDSVYGNYWTQKFAISTTGEDDSCY